MPPHILPFQASKCFSVANIPIFVILAFLPGLEITDERGGETGLGTAPLLDSTHIVTSAHIVTPARRPIPIHRPAGVRRRQAKVMKYLKNRSLLRRGSAWRTTTIIFMSSTLCTLIISDH